MPKQGKTINNLDVVQYLDSRKFTVLWSGGKDSTAVLLWVANNIHHERWNILFVEVTGNTHPLNIQYVHGVAKQLGVSHKLIHVGRNDLDFFEMMKKYGLPTFHKRWCLNRFKQPFFRQTHRIQVLGIRRSDGFRRRNMKLVEWFRSTDNIVVNPIVEWTKRRVIDYIRAHEISLNPCYRLFGHSGNCMFCPFHKAHSIIRTLNDPLFGKKIKQILLLVEAKNKSQLARDKYIKWRKHIGQRLLVDFPFYDSEEV